MGNTKSDGFGLIPSILIALGAPLAGILLIVLTISWHQNAQWDLAAVRHGEITTVQEELKANQGNYAESVGELKDSLKIADLPETAESIADLVASDSAWCVVLFQRTGSRPDWALAVSSEKDHPEPFETTDEASIYCRSAIR